jgi:hypothetical protein
LIYLSTSKASPNDSKIVIIIIIIIGEVVILEHRGGIIAQSPLFGGFIFPPDLDELRLLAGGHGLCLGQNAERPARRVRALLGGFGVLAGVIFPEQNTLPNTYYRAKQ